MVQCKSAPFKKRTHFVTCPTIVWSLPNIDSYLNNHGYVNFGLVGPILQIGYFLQVPVVLNVNFGAADPGNVMLEETAIVLGLPGIAKLKLYDPITSYSKILENIHSANNYFNIVQFLNYWLQFAAFLVRVMYNF